ncbi:MAG: hydrogenase expression/formation protein HypE [Endomicrobia bacterium]|nr:hydrogenase expression/formation protein HypE [Endomicrobiia bacterium]MDW8055704.1 hydrogenase expression/formation protein HypE [Elusimicrobiota bacterium]
MKDKILISYGTGGKYTQEFINNYVLKHFKSKILSELLDSAVLNFEMDSKIAFTTDSYTVSPIFFPGGDIGKLSICGTINDLLCVGAIPKYISVSLIIEEGLEFEVIDKILSSIEEVANEENVEIVTGDTKVVEKGSCDKVFITTAGIGVVNKNICLHYNRISPGDVVIISGNIAEHGLAVLLSRGGFGFDCKIQSDCSSLKPMLEQLFNKEISSHIKFMRDPTRGGISAVLNEVVHKRKDVSIEIEEELVPLSGSVKNLCELLSFDPLNIANEGKVVIIVDKNFAEETVKVLRQHPLGKNARIIGEVTTENKGRVILKTTYGTKRIVDMPIAEELPRIC